ncbi:hypothetical protein SAMN05444146_5248 [Flavobacterium johnsoniae]|nr:hypothetical protein SAMN05444146_5248 [Flavobacterium johnsoniae]
MKKVLIVNVNSELTEKLRKGNHIIFKLFISKNYSISKG